MMHASMETQLVMRKALSGNCRYGATVRNNKTVEAGYFDILNSDQQGYCTWEVTYDFNGRNKKLVLCSDTPFAVSGKFVSEHLVPGFCLTFLGDDFVYVASQAEFESIPNTFGDVILEIRK